MTTLHAPSRSDQLGAIPLSDSLTHFRVWAPNRQRIAVEADGALYKLTRDDGGYFTGTAPVATGALYRYVLDDDLRRPDPASRFQPHGVHGESQVVDPDAFAWSDADWRGVAKRDLVIYELHLGAFTQAGTFRAAIDRLPELVELGVTTIELMPLVQSPGKWNWGYDGVDLFAVRETYGHPDDLRALVDACHDCGLAVLLDVVYNHVGPEGNYLADFGPYASRRHGTPWGSAFNFDGRRRKAVRRFVVENAITWLDEYHLDGLRLDAAHFMHDQSERHILHDISEAVAEFKQSAGREVHLIAEANVYDHELLAPPDNGPPYDAIWCDCLMHSLYSHAAPDVRLTGREYRGAPDIAETIQHGYLYVDAHHERAGDAHRERFHSETDDRSHLASLVMALQTHDAVGNHPHGKRIHQLTSKEFQRAAAALVLLYPSIPLIFMGEESAVESPFPFFVDFEDRRLRRAVNKGRAREYPTHDRLGAPLPTRESTFLSAKCDATARHDPEMRHWYRQLLALRREGLAEGWLSPEHLTTRWDQRNSLYELHFDKPGGGRVCVLSRLAKDASTAVVQSLGEVAICSQGQHVGATGELTLEGNHTVVVVENVSSLSASDA